jgi:bifunctional non-homologous end joining protein LigD
VPLNAPGVTYEQTKGFAKAVGELLEGEFSELVVSRQTKTLRKGKVLVDWSQNDEHKTTVCVYSPRARDRPTVSTPLTWEEIRDALAAEDAGRLVFETRDVVRRVDDQGDLFGEVLALVQEVPAP